MNILIWWSYMFWLWEGFMSTYEVLDIWFVLVSHVTLKLFLKCHCSFRCKNSNNTRHKNLSSSLYFLHIPTFHDHNLWMFLAYGLSSAANCTTTAKADVLLLKLQTDRCPVLRNYPKSPIQSNTSHKNCICKYYKLCSLSRHVSQMVNRLVSLYIGRQGSQIVNRLVSR